MEEAGSLQARSTVVFDDPDIALMLEFGLHCQQTCSSLDLSLPAMLGTPEDLRGVRGLQA